MKREKPKDISHQHAYNQVKKFTSPVQPKIANYVHHSITLKKLDLPFSPFSASTI